MKINEIERTRVRSPPRATSLKKTDLSVEPLLAHLLLVLVVGAAVLQVLADEVARLGGLDGAVVVIVQLLVQGSEIYTGEQLGHEAKLQKHKSIASFSNKYIL
jgi:hypothetical protein